jgi:hypothetical protein
MPHDRVFGGRGLDEYCADPEDVVRSVEIFSDLL